MKKHEEAKETFWKMGFLATVSLLWLVIRTGGKPSRITYPCQKAAVANIHIFLLTLFAPGLAFGKFKTALPHALDSRFTTTVLLISSLLLAFGSVAFTGNYISIQSSSVPVPIDLQTHNAISSVNSSDLFFIENASGTEGNMDGAVSSLLQLMAAHGLSFFKTAGQPSGLIGKNDVVIIKVNSEWNQRGGTNLDLVKSIVKEIVNHPEGFTGEVVIADNGQWTDRTDQSQWYTPSNAYNQSQSMYDVANSFPAYKVSSWLWDIVRKIQVNEYSQGDSRDGYVVSSTTDPDTYIRVSYPKFRTKYGTYISLKNGIWTGSNYDFGRLKLINVPVLKSHSSYGVTGCIKHYMGVLSNVPALGFSDGHGLIRYGAMGTVMAETKFPTLNILDCIYVNANPVESSALYGPDTSYEAASYTNIISASQDPVALDYWASKHILVPAAQQLGYTSYNSLDPDYGPTVPQLQANQGYSFNGYLTNSMNELKNHGFQVTMNESQMNVYVSTLLGRVQDLNTNQRYGTIQEAIDADETLNGHTLLVGVGTYYEHIVIDKSIMLTGENDVSTIIDGNETGSVVTITADNVKISGFTIRRGGSTPSGSDSGVYVNSSNNTISGNIIINNVAGITLSARANYNEIYHNSFLNNTVLFGAQARAFGATASSYSDGHPPSLAVDGVENPLNYWGTNAGVPEGRVPQWLDIDLGSDLNISTVTTHFYDGDARTYTYYIEVSNDNSSWTRIVNTKTGNGSVADTFHQLQARYVRITITANTVNPAAHIEEIKIYGSIDRPGNNSWDNGYPSGGNYWSSYTGPDLYSGPNQDQLGSDGIVDTPYGLNENGADHYPLMRPSLHSHGDVQPPLGTIDMKDVSYVARRFMCVPGDPLWDPNADFSGDGKINMKDVALPARHFQEHS